MVGALLECEGDGGEMVMIFMMFQDPLSLLVMQSRVLLKVCSLCGMTAVLDFLL